MLTSARREREVQKGLAQLKLAFDSLEKAAPGLSADALAQMFALCAASSNPEANAIVGRRS
jgi:hypothetical protein